MNGGFEGMRIHISKKETTSARYDQTSGRYEPNLGEVWDFMFFHRRGMHTISKRIARLKFWVSGPSPARFDRQSFSGQIFKASEYEILKSQTSHENSRVIKTQSIYHFFLDLLLLDLDLPLALGFVARLTVLFSERFLFGADAFFFTTLDLDLEDFEDELRLPLVDLDLDLDF